MSSVMNCLKSPKKLFSGKFFIMLGLAALVLCSILYSYKSKAPESLKTLPLQMSAYNGAKIEGDDLPVFIRAGSNEGLQITVDAPLKNVSRLSMKGQSLKGNPILELSSSRLGSYTLPLPDGLHSLWLPPDKDLELHIVSDKPFEYKLEEFVINQEPESMDDEQFKSFVLHQVPGLKDALDNNRKLQAAWLLLQWSARVSDLGSNMPPSSPGHFIGEMDAAQIYQNLWENDAGGEACGGFALFYAKLLSLFNINAFLVETGFSPKEENPANLAYASSYYFTHGTTIVAVPSGSSWKFYLFDPTSAGTFMDEEGNFMDMATLMTHYDHSTRTFDKNYWTAEQCFPRDVIRHNAQGAVATIEKNKPYCVKNMIKGWSKKAHSDTNPLAEQLDSYPTNPNTNIFIDLLLSNIFSPGKESGRSYESEFREFIDKEHAKAKPPTAEN